MERITHKRKRDELTNHGHNTVEIREQSNSQRRRPENAVFRMDKTLRVMLTRLPIDELRKNGNNVS